MSNRKDIRARLAVMLRNGLVTVPAENVFAYRPFDVGGRSPVVYMTSSGSLRQSNSFEGGRLTAFVNVHVLVLYASESGEWNEEQAEDLLDEVEGEIADLVGTPATAVDQGWGAIGYADRSDADSEVMIGGATYLHEVIPLMAEVYE